MENPETKVTLPNGTEVQFGPPSVWDSVKFREQFGKNIEALGMEKLAIDAMSKEERDEYEDFRNRGTLWLVWRCACAGGYEGTEEAFWTSVPVTGGTFTKIVEVATSFFGEQQGSEMSSDSSGAASGGTS